RPSQLLLLASYYYHLLCFLLVLPLPPRSTLFPYTTLFRSIIARIKKSPAYYFCDGLSTIRCRSVSHKCCRLFVKTVLRRSIEADGSSLRKSTFPIFYGRSDSVPRKVSCRNGWRNFLYFY